MTEPRAFVGLDVGGSNIKALALGPEGGILAEENLPTLDDGSRGWLERARGVFRKVVSRCPAPVVVGVAAPGLLRV